MPSIAKKPASDDSRAKNDLKPKIEKQDPQTPLSDGDLEDPL